MRKKISDKTLRALADAAVEVKKKLLFAVFAF